MTRSAIDRSLATGCSRHGPSWVTIARWMAAGAMILALSPSPAHAQLGRLKKLKQKFSAPDSAARAKDSLAQIAAGVLPESVKVGKSFLQKSASVVSSANGALESATGISAKDAALAATGIGASNLVAKKLGLDPMSIASQAIANAKMSAQQRAMQKSTGAGGLGSSGAGGMDPVQLQSMQRAAMGNAAASARANSAGAGGAMVGDAAMGGYTQADAEALVAFQQEMMELSIAASAGDSKAQARLQAWERIALKYQAEMQKLSIAASGGDMTAAQKMQRLQFDLIKEWSSTGATRAKLPKAKKQ
jgi:hypothetical protein